MKIIIIKKLLLLLLFIKKLFKIIVFINYFKDNPLFFSLIINKIFSLLSTYVSFKEGFIRYLLTG
jgi:hypothetical protein